MLPEIQTKAKRNVRPIQLLKYIRLPRVGLQELLDFVALPLAVLVNAPRKS